MRGTAIAGILLLALVLATAIAALSGGLPLGPQADEPGTLTERWVSETAREIGGNHHAPVAGRVDGRPVVFAPISGAAHDHASGAHEHPGAGGCALVAIHATNGSVSWDHRIPPANCTVHSVADPTLADIDSDGTEEVLVATTEDVVKAFDPVTGDVTFTYALSSYGYTRPLVANVTGDTAPELVVVDVKGSVFVVEPTGTTVWRRLHTAYTWGQPGLDDFDADGAPEVFVGLGNGTMVLYDAGDGAIRWRRTRDGDSSITWTTTGQLDGDPAREIGIATVDGTVSVYDGRDGSRQWATDLGAFAAIHAVGDGDGDGTPEVYAVARDGAVRSLNGATGDVEWATNLTSSPAQMMPPPAIGDLDGDGTPELVAVTNHGRVAVLDPATGTILATDTRDARIWTHPTLADTDGDGREEVYVIYGDGRVAALEYSPPDA